MKKSPKAGKAPRGANPGPAPPKSSGSISGVWKSVPLESNLAAKGFKEGQMGIETVKEYKVVGNRNAAAIKKEKEPKIFKTPLPVAPLAATTSSLVEKPTPKRKKKFKKKRPKVPVKETSSSSSASSNSSKETSPCAADDAEGQTKKKKKKTRQKRKPKALKNKAKLMELKKEAVKEEEKEEEEDEKEKEVMKAEEPSEDLDMSAWSSLLVPEPIIKALRLQGFSEPTPIQREVLPAALGARMDVVGAAETGSGKTLAFGIPIIAGILQDLEYEEKHRNEENENPDSDVIEDVEMKEEGVDDDDVSEEEEEAIEKDVFSDSDFSDMSDSEATSGCVKVVNNVVFDFEGYDSETEEMYMPPMDILETLGDGMKAPMSGQKKKGAGKLRALVLAPTRELAIQVKDHIERLTKFTPIRIAAILGGMAAQKQRRLLSYGPEIVVATPGRLWDLIQEGEPHLAGIGQIKYLAVDETDRMVEKGHFEELHKLMELLQEQQQQEGEGSSKPRRRQTFVFSATLSLVHDLPRNLQTGKKGAQRKKLTTLEKIGEVTQLLGVREGRKKIVDLSNKRVTAEALTEARIHCDKTEKDFYLYYFTQMHPGRTLVFCNSIDCVRRLNNLFSPLQVNLIGLHADMHQKQRLKNLERFTADPRSVLVATDVAARGLDIPNVEHVVHYQVPKTSESYVHRSGRTARATKSGLSVMFIEPQENLSFKKICKTLNKSGVEKELPLFPIDRGMFAAVRQRIQVARELDKLKLDARKEDVEKSWWKKAACEADLLVSSEGDSEEEEFNGGSSERLRAQRRQRIETKSRELTALLAVPLTSQGFSGKYPTKSGRLELPEEVAGESVSALEAIERDAAETKRLLRGSGSKKRKGSSADSAAAEFKRNKRRKKAKKSE